MSAWDKVLAKAFTGNKSIKNGNPDVIIVPDLPNVATTALVGTLCWDSTNEDAYICTVASGTWVKINA